MGDSWRAGMLQLPGSAKLISSAEQVISHVVAIRAVVEETPVVAAEGAAVAEPELIRKAKADDEGAEEKKK